jgi:hypothetical protein
MFGLNDNNQQTNDPSAAPAAPAAASAMPANPFGDPAPATSEPAVTAPAPAAPDPLPKLPSQPPEAPTVSKHSDPLAAKSDDLMDLKEQALHSLQPLVSHLDQTPEEKFKTTMMLIQATDNSSLVKEAFEAANQITDEKTRAQALLDVVNEINYFTQHHDDQATEAKA